MELKKSKKMIFVATALLIVCSVLLISASYAWIALSRMPEVSGISTNIGANGSLEIALLSAETYVDPSLIKTRIGESLENSNPSLVNQYWGSILDLSDPNYGLNDVTLIPSRLQVDQLRTVGNTLLSIPDYGEDGRFGAFANNTATGSYRFNEQKVGAFTFNSAVMDFGVRGIGSVMDIDAQNTLLLSSRTAIEKYRVSARTGMINLWKTNGSELMYILDCTYGTRTGLNLNRALEALNDTAQDMFIILDDIYTALRYSILGYASIMIHSEIELKQFETIVLNKNIPLSVLTVYFPIVLPEIYARAISNIESDLASMQRVTKECEQYKQQGNLRETDVRVLLANFFRTNSTYINETPLYQWDGSTVLHADNRLTVINGTSMGAVMHTVGRYVGDLQAFCNYDGKSVQFETLQDDDADPILVVAADMLKLEEDNQEQGEIIKQLEDVYGYAVDMAFRCNAASNLLLQTSSRPLVDAGMGVQTEQGGGSFMRFTSEQMKPEQIALMMDAIRVGFVDNKNNLLCVAKLNTSNYENSRDGVTAPLYLYDFTVRSDGGIEMGERRSEDNVILSLEQDVPAVLTAVVWLDGDCVDNSLAAIRDQSMVGILNLQFASSADLKPAVPNDTTRPTEPPTPTDATEPTDSTETTEPTGSESEIVSSGTCGEGLTWTLDREGTLTISGTGAMASNPFTSIRDSVKNIVIEDGVTTIGESAFFDFKKLYSVSIPNSVVNIGRNAFRYSTLRSVDIPDSVEKIEYLAFQDCSYLLTVSIGSGVTSIADNVFDYCGSLMEINVSDANEYYSSDAQGILYNKDKTTLYRAPCGISGAVVIPEDVNHIEDYAFSDCHSMDSVEIPYTVWSIGDYAFSGCSSLYEIDIPNNVSVIPYEAFSYCYNLHSIEISEYVWLIENNAFDGCQNLRRFEVSPYNSNYSSDYQGILYNADQTELIKAPEGISGDIDIPYTVQCIQDYAFYNCNNISTVYIPYSVWDIGDDAFTGCDNLEKFEVDYSSGYSGDDQGILYNADKTVLIKAPAKIESVVIPSTVTKIEKYAFSNCYWLEDVVIPGSVKTVGSWAFECCWELEQVAFSDGVTQIGWGAFSDCSKLKTVVLADSIEKIDEYAFNCCSSIWHVLYTGDENAWNSMSILNAGNQDLLDATRHYNCTGNETLDAQNKTCSICGS